METLSFLKAMQQDLGLNKNQCLGIVIKKFSRGHLFFSSKPGSRNTNPGSKGISLRELFSKKPILSLLLLLDMTLRARA